MITFTHFTIVYIMGFFYNSGSQLVGHDPKLIVEDFCQVANSNLSSLLKF